MSTLRQLAIKLECFEDASNITLNSHGLRIDEKSISLSQINGTSDKSSIKISKLGYDIKQQHAIIYLEENARANNQYRLSMDFEGTLGDSLAGFYKIKYRMQNATADT